MGLWPRFPTELIIIFFAWEAVDVAVRLIRNLPK